MRIELIRAHRSAVEKILDFEKFIDYSTELKKFMDITEEVDDYYWYMISRIFDKYAERDCDGNFLFENNFFVVKDANKNIIMALVRAVELQEIDNDEITAAIDALKAIKIISEEKITIS